MRYNPLLDPRNVDLPIGIEELCEEREFGAGDEAKKQFVSGCDCYAQKKFEEALTFFGKVEKLCPEDAHQERISTHYNKALCFEKLGDLKACVSELEVAHSLYDRHRLVLAQLIRICDLIGEPEFAEKAKNYAALGSLF